MKAIISLLLCICLMFLATEAIPTVVDDGGADETQVDIQDTGSHFTEEIEAEAMCQTLAIRQNRYGWVYAVGRHCGGPHTCQQICASSYLHTQDSQTVHRTWTCIGAFHVYQNRPPTTYGNVQNARLGLKTYYYNGGCTIQPCGPNFCCCHVV